MIRGNLRTKLLYSLCFHNLDIKDHSGALCSRVLYSWMMGSTSNTEKRNVAHHSIVEYVLKKSKKKKNSCGTISIFVFLLGFLTCDKVNSNFDQYSSFSLLKIFNNLEDYWSTKNKLLLYHINLLVLEWNLLDRHLFHEHPIGIKFISKWGAHLFFFRHFNVLFLQHADIGRGICYLLLRYQNYSSSIASHA